MPEKPIHVVLGLSHSNCNSPVSRFWQEKGWHRNNNCYKEIAASIASTHLSLHSCGNYFPPPLSLVLSCRFSEQRECLLHPFSWTKKKKRILDWSKTKWDCWRCKQISMSLPFFRQEADGQCCLPLRGAYYPMDISEVVKADGKGGPPEGRARGPRTGELFWECRTGATSKRILYSQFTPFSNGCFLLWFCPCSTIVFWAYMGKTICLFEF